MITIGPGNEGYAARRRSESGHATGPEFSALGLDQLADILDREEAT